MSLYVNGKNYSANIVINKGLSNIDIMDTDIRPGKISIDSDGNKLESAGQEKILSKLTDDANITAADVTMNKIIYANGKRLVGTYQSNSDISTLINGDKKNYPVALGAYINAGDFVRVLSDGTVNSYQPNSGMSGIALQNGTYGQNIDIVVPK